MYFVGWSEFFNADVAFGASDLPFPLRILPQYFTIANQLQCSGNGGNSSEIYGLGEGELWGARKRPAQISILCLPSLI